MHKTPTLLHVLEFDVQRLIVQLQVVVKGSRLTHRSPSSLGQTTTIIVIILCPVMCQVVGQVVSQMVDFSRDHQLTATDAVRVQACGG